MLEAATEAFVAIVEPHRLLVLFSGVVLGLILGILPGIGGIAGIALLMPFTFGMDPYTAFAFLLGLAAVTSTGDPIPAIMFGVPGGAGSAATVLDGLPMARRGEAGRALSAAYMSSLMGGLFGAALLGLTIPLLRPLVLFIGSPELLALSVFGISMVAVLAGNTPLKGLAAAGLGIMLAMIGSDPQSGTMRWTLDLLYLWDGLPLLPITLGLFALPELCDLAISRTSIASNTKVDVRAGMLQGARDCFRHIFLVLRCSWLGASLGAVPGIGSAIIDWLAYAHAVQTEKGARETFGRGDVRGVIASESANNAKEGGALVPTIAFGVPGSASMAILLGAFLIHGLVPGPGMLTENLSVTYSLVWSIAIANILGAGLCYLFSGQFAKLATLRYTLILPTVLALIYIGAFEGSRDWGDLWALLVFGVLGWVMKQLKWPRPPLILGFVLGAVIERYLYISIGRYGAEFLLKPLVAILLAMSVLALLRPMLREVRVNGGFGAMLANVGRPRFRAGDLFTVGLIGVIGTMLVQSLDWPLKAKLIPLIVGPLALLFATLSLLNSVLRSNARHAGGLAEEARAGIAQSTHMDIASDTGHLPQSLVIARAGQFFAWMLGFMLSMWLIGLIPTVVVFVVAFMRIEGRERWRIVLPYAILLTLFVYVVFDRLLLIPWPQTLLGTMVPALDGVIPSL